MMFFQARFDGKNPECVAHALLLSQEKMKNEHGGRDVISDKDVYNQSRILIGAGKYYTTSRMLKEASSKTSPVHVSCHT